MKHLLLFILVIVLLPYDVHALLVKKYEKTIKTVSTIEYILSRMKPARVEDMVYDFVKNSRPSRMVGKQGHSKAIEYLKKTINKFDRENSGKLYVEQFDPDIDHAIAQYRNEFNKEIAGKYLPGDPIYQKWNNFTLSVINLLNSLRGVKGTNLVWEKKGKGRAGEILVVGANFDTMAYDPKTLMAAPNVEMPGADNNATGVATLLGLIQFLSELDIKKTVRVVFFDFEELGFLGTKAYLAAHQDEHRKIKGFVNVMMLGHDSKTGDRTKHLGNMRAYIQKPSERGYPKDIRLAKKMVYAGKSIRPQVRFEITANSLTSGGHINFWKVGIPAMAFSQNWDDDFNKDRNHTPNDFVETLNMTTFNNSFRYINGAIIAWAFDLTRK